MEPGCLRGLALPKFILRLNKDNIYSVPFDSQKSLPLDVSYIVTLVLTFIFASRKANGDLISPCIYLPIGTAGHFPCLLNIESPMQ